MNTPMQELIEQLKELKAYIAVTHGLERSLPYQTAIDYAETMLEQEKDTMKSCIVMGMEFIPVDPNNYNEDAEEVYNETFNTQPKMDELTQLRKLAGLLQSAWHNGNWKAETYNEREMEKIMTEQGYWPALPNPNQVRKDKLLTVNTSVKINKQEILNQLNQHIKACSEASLADAVMAFHEAIKLVEQLDENEKQGPEVRWKPQPGEFILVRDHDSAEWKVLRFMQMARDGKGVVGQTPSGDKFTWSQYKRIDKAILDILYKTFNTKEK